MNNTTLFRLIIGVFIFVLHFPDVGELEAVAFAAVNVPHGDSREGCTKGGEAEDEHRGGVGGIGLVGAAYTHWDDGAAEVLDEEDHRVSRT